MSQGRASLTDCNKVNPDVTPSRTNELRQSATNEKSEQQHSLERKSSTGAKRVTRADIIKNAIIPDFGVNNNTPVVSREPATLFGSQRIAPAPEMPQKRKTKTRFEYIVGK